MVITCGHCGGKSYVVKDFKPYYWVTCKECGATSGVYTTAEAAVKAWNKRMSYQYDEEQRKIKDGE